MSMDSKWVDISLQSLTEKLAPSTRPTATLHVKAKSDSSSTVTRCDGNAIACCVPAVHFRLENLDDSESPPLAAAGHSESETAIL